MANDSTWLLALLEGGASASVGAGLGQVRYIFNPFTGRFDAVIEASGIAGIAGPPGDPGSDGEPGDQGPPGPAGSTGATGATGATGSTGATGLQGLAGPPGMDGDDGEAGEAGPPGPAGSGSGGSGVAKQVAFWSAPTTLAGDDAFQWDTATKALQVGTPTTGAFSLTFMADDGFGSLGFTQAFLQAYSLVLENYANSGGQLRMRAAEGTITAPTATLNNRALGLLLFQGWSSPGLFATGAEIRGSASELWTNTAHGTRLTFSTVTIGATSLLERMRISPAGNVGIGGTSTTSMLNVGATDQFQVSSTGDVVKLKNLTYSWPSAHLARGVLTDDGAGTLSWAASVPGAPGLDGEDGEDGSPGPAGSTGATGATGAAGAAGAAGAPGPPGEDGLDGEDGLPGPIGPAGASGSSTPFTFDGGTDTSGLKDFGVVNTGGVNDVSFDGGSP